MAKIDYYKSQTIAQAVASKAFEHLLPPLQEQKYLLALPAPKEQS